MAFTGKNKIEWVYGKQIERGCKKSEIDLELFKLCQQLSILDWKAIRGKEFWKKYDELKSPYERNNFVLQSVRAYFNP